MARVESYPRVHADLEASRTRLRELEGVLVELRGGRREITRLEFELAEVRADLAEVEGRADQLLSS